MTLQKQIQFYFSIYSDSLVPWNVYSYLTRVWNNFTCGCIPFRKKRTLWIYMNSKPYQLAPTPNNQLSWRTVCSNIIISWSNIIIILIAISIVISALYSLHIHIIMTQQGRCTYVNNVKPSFTWENSLIALQLLPLLLLSQPQLQDGCTTSVPGGHTASCFKGFNFLLSYLKFT